jgi:hypothetical protein
MGLGTFVVATILIVAAGWFINSRPMDVKLVKWGTIALGVIWALMALSVLGVFTSLAA